MTSFATGNPSNLQTVNVGDTVILCTRDFGFTRRKICTVQSMTPTRVKIAEQDDTAYRKKDGVLVGSTRLVQYLRRVISDTEVQEILDEIAAKKIRDKFNLGTLNKLSLQQLQQIEEIVWPTNKTSEA